jgi:Putative prokaryotic signal transducing protein
VALAFDINQMKELFRHSDAALVAVYQSVLESAGIQTFVRNSNTQQAIVGDILAAVFPLPEFWPTLCVMNDDEYPDAMGILRDTKDEETSKQRQWECPQCRELVPGHFVLCWNCGHILPDTGL